MSSRASRNNRKLQRRGMFRKVWNGFWLVVVVAVLVFHAAAGWVFSGRIFEGALAIAPPTEQIDVEVADIAGSQILLRELSGDVPDLTRGEVMGLELDASYLQLGEIHADGATGVRRSFTVIDGDPPAVGERGDIEATAFPEDPARAGLSIREVEYTSRLGLMDAWRLDGSNSVWVIHVHGKGASLSETARLLGPLAEAGYNQLAINYRNDPGQPSDPSGMYQYGATEWEDLAGAVDYALAEGASKVVIVGYSTGGGIAIAYMIRFPDKVAAAILDAPNLDMSATIDLRARDERLPGGLPLPPTLPPIAKFLAALRYQINWDQLDYVKRAGQITAPVLVFHGTEDDWVPIETSRDFAEARPDFVRLVEVEGAGHVQAWNADPGGYETQVLEFLASVPG